MRLQQKAEKLSTKVFTGGPVEHFETVGRLQLIALLREGLYPDSKVLDIGCGCLRGGYWLIHFLDPGCYFGIESNKEMLDAGLNHLLEPGLLETKQPRFDYNANFDSSVFQECFDFFLARSVWTHASKAQIQKMLDSFRTDSTDDAVFLTSYLRSGLSGRRDYGGESWVGRSHECDTPGMVSHDLSWIERECQYRSLIATELKEREYNFNRQVWLKITKTQ